MLWDRLYEDINIQVPGELRDGGKDFGYNGSPWIQPCLRVDPPPQPREPIVCISLSVSLLLLLMPPPQNPGVCRGTL